MPPKKATRQTARGGGGRGRGRGGKSGTDSSSGNSDQPLQYPQLSEPQFRELVRHVREVLSPIPAVFEEFRSQMRAMHHLTLASMAAAGNQSLIPMPMQGMSANVNANTNGAANDDLNWLVQTFNQPGMNNMANNPIVATARHLVDDGMKRIGQDAAVDPHDKQKEEMMTQLTQMRQQLEEATERLEGMSQANNEAASLDG